MAVDINHGKESARAFVLYTADRELSKKQHTCYIYGNFQLGKPVFQREKPYLWDMAPITPGFIGQTKLKYELIKNFFAQNDQQWRYVRLTGPKGSGKSSLAAHTVNYV